MQFDRTMAYRKGDDVAILQQNQPVQGFRYDAQAGKLIPAEIPEAMKKEALAYALWGSYAYKQRLYKTDAQQK